MDQLVFQVETTEGGRYVACACGEAIFTEAASLDELRTQVHDAVRCHFAHRPGPKAVQFRFMRNAVPAT
jgi:hypothetical protein